MPNRSPTERKFENHIEKYLNSIEYKYTKFDYISWWFLTAKEVPNYVAGDFEFHFKDIKAYKLK